jgi:hypothetical protein
VGHVFHIAIHPCLEFKLKTNPITALSFRLSPKAQSLSTYLGHFFLEIACPNPDKPDLFILKLDTPQAFESGFSYSLDGIHSAVESFCPGHCFEVVVPDLDSNGLSLVSRPQQIL